VGRSTIREAIRELAGKGVLATRQGSGAFLTALETADERESTLRRASIVAVIEARIAIESEAAALAALRRSPTDLRALRRGLAERSRAGLSLAAYVDADMALHRAVVGAAHNEVLLDLFDGFVPRIRPAMIEMLQHSSSATEAAGGAADLAAHAALVDAIADRDATAAADLSRTHLSDLKAALA